MNNYFNQIKKTATATSYPEISRETIIENWCKAWSGWHSPEFNTKMAEWEASGKQTKKKPVRDNEYLRNAILSKFPITKTSLSIPEILENWHNASWWQENINNVISIIDNMYVKKSVKAYNGIYANWLTRIVQFINTYIAEKTIKEAFNFIWNEVDHTNIHSGVATAEECKPDFIASTPGRETVELKLCENESSILNHYFARLKENFAEVKEHDFHNANIAMFCTKDTPNILYTVKLDSPASLNLDDRQTIAIPLIPTKNGRITDRKDNPAVPFSLLFGLTPHWQH